MPTEYTVPAQGGDRWVEFFAPTGLTETRYIKAVQGLPGRGSHRVVHHITTTVLQDSDQDEELFGNPETGGTAERFLNEYAVGKNAEVLTEGAGRPLKAGSVVKFQLHYHSSGEEVKDRSRIGFAFYPKGYVPKYYEISAVAASIRDLDLPPGADNVRWDGYQRFNRPIRLTAIQAHMHNRGKRMCIEAILPNGNVQDLNCFKFDFAWHKTYTYADDAAPLLPAGTMLHIIGWHDNSPANRNNPDPRNWVGYGFRTSDEMGHSWLTWNYLEESDYKRMVAERAARGTR
jgi:hypothetical protein